MAEEKKKGLEFSEEEMNALRRIAYGGFKKTPDTIRRLKSSQTKRIPGGAIDYAFYSGKTKDPRYLGIRMDSDFMYNDAEEGSASFNFNKIREHLGIKNVDSTEDLRQLYDYVFNYKPPVKEQKKVEEKPVEEVVEEEKPTTEVVESPEPTISEEDIKEKTPTTPYQVGQRPLTIRNPSKRKVRGGISQFASGGSGGKVATIKSKLLNI